MNRLSPPWELQVLAGKTALAHIRRNGLSATDIQLVMGASGAAKWLSIYGLDRAVFSQWLSNTPLHLFGTSIGAWKLCAAAQRNPALALDRLKQAYIRQDYTGHPSPREISRQSHLILDHVFPRTAMDDILSHPTHRIAFGTVRCRGPLGQAHRPLQGLGLATAFGLSRLGRHCQRVCFERVIFHHPQFNTSLLDTSDFPTRYIPLTRDNFRAALLASGSIPFYMEGIKDIPGAPRGTYRDGGILDYHPTLPLASKEGFILYPHFFPHLIQGWFDKYTHSGRAQSPLTDRIILLAPSPAFVATLPRGKIPDRKDLEDFMDHPGQRKEFWTRAADHCQRLGKIFLEGIKTHAIRDWVRPLP
ncbi:MAG: patatin-like phospholipase family protein [Desulfovibrionales bacterium]|nr:patatin-like phospholipase family protein [Desulfovibrionales bacterium]